MVSLIRLVIMFVRFAAPWIVRAAVGTATLIAMAVGSLWVGVPTALRRIADEWVDRAVSAGFPTMNAPDLHRAIQFVAFLIIVGAWVIFSFATVWLLGRIF